MRSTTKEAVGSDTVTAELAAVLDRLGTLALDPAPGPDAARIDRITLLERLRSAVAAAQQAEMVAFAHAQVTTQEAQILDGTLHPRALGRGIADQIALACRVSPFTGSRRLTVARALHTDLPDTRAALAAGQISEDTAEKVASETTHLDHELRRHVDRQLAAAGLGGLSRRQAEVAIRAAAYDADRAGYVTRGRTARTHRRVGLRPAPDTMSVLTGFLPVEQGVACLAALRARIDTIIAAGDERSRDQIMADTLVARLTGQATAEDTDVEVVITMPVTALLDPDTGTAQVLGHGPIPARIATDILTTSEGRRWWRRLFTTPGSGLPVGADPRRRCFDGLLAFLIALRDGGRCRDPYCDAPIHEVDHIQAFRHGGPRTLSNGRGICQRGNRVREMPGWHVDLDADGLDGRPHTVRVTTPTGHSYTDDAPGP